ncbi:transposase [Candidatus Woesearchaeota archaeon]|nr:transposase [Candidatus Woesearchaeota archaeon]
MKYKTRRKLRHDNQDFKYLLKNLQFNQVVADRGYDDKKLRSYVINKLKSIPIIPYRKTSGVRSLKVGRRKPKIDENKYHQRSKIETIFSVIKRKYGSVLRNKSYATQQVELISKLITHNLDRKLNYLLLILGVAPEPILKNFNIKQKNQLFLTIKLSYTRNARTPI